MNEVEQTTLHQIFSVAMQEFLEKGFKSASLRNIVKTAGVTILPLLPASVCMKCFCTPMNT